MQRSLEGLNAAETQELASLLRAFPHVDAGAFDRAVAAVFVSCTPVSESMPAELFEKIEAHGEAIVATQARLSVHTHAPRAHVATRSDPRSRQRNRSLQTRRRRPGLSIPWIVAAASLAFALLSWWPMSPGPQTDPLNQRTALIAAGAQVQAWAATEDPTALNAAGDVVWDAARQEGYMRFSLLAANNPSEFQYQLWIFDAERDERYPVDGGVFDIPPGASEVIVPIRASVPVDNAVLFAVTVEAPGGVVVSDRERIALVAEFAQV